MADAFDRHYTALMKARDEIVPLLRARGETLFLKLAQLRSEIWEHADAMLRDLDEGHFYIGTR